MGERRLVRIRKAEVTDSIILTEMVVSLLSELSGEEIEEIDQDKYLNTCVKLLEIPEIFFALLAFNNSDKCIGVITATRSCSIYAAGIFGIIQELYVLPDYRSKQIGRKLIEELVSFAKTSGWCRIEVGAPNADIWDKTIRFYKREGFEEIGPRLKLVL